MRRYMTHGRKPRDGFYELFPAGNIDDEGGILAPDSPRAQYGRVYYRFLCLVLRSLTIRGQRPLSRRLIVQSPPS